MRRWRKEFRWLYLLGVIVLLTVWHGGSLWLTDRGIRNVEEQVFSRPVVSSEAKPWHAMRFFGDPDAYQWLSLARDLRASGGLRMRQTAADNTPFGREVHWAHLPIWTLAALAQTFEHLVDLSSPVALEWAGRALMPLIGFLYGVALFLILARRLHPWLAGLATVAIAISSLYDFHPLRPDHHGFQTAFAVAALLLFMTSGMGWTTSRRNQKAPLRNQPPTYPSARRYLLASGICSGMALWLGATVFTFFLFALATGTALALLTSPSPPTCRVDLHFYPNLYRQWGLAGAGCALLFYLLEYAPGPFSMRLEVNHPAYALWFWGTAECLRALALWKHDHAAFQRRDLGMALVGTTGAALLPLLLLFGPGAWVIPRSPLMLQLHSRYIIDFLPPWHVAPLPVYLEHAPILLLGGLTLALARYADRHQGIPFFCRPPLIVLGAVSLMMGLLYHWQCRWFAFLPPVVTIFSIYLVSAMSQARQDAPPSRRPAAWLPIVLAGLICAQAAHAAFRDLRPLVQMFRAEHMDAGWLQFMLQRNAILQLKAASGGERMRLILPVAMAPAAHYFGLGDAVASLYWENEEGLAATAEFLGDPLPGQRARQVVRERRLTHLLVDSSQRDTRMFYHLLYGKADAPDFQQTLGGALSQPTDARLPDWLCPDQRLTDIASQAWYIYIPANQTWAQFHLPLQVVAFQP